VCGVRRVGLRSDPGEEVTQPLPSTHETVALRAEVKALRAALDEIRCEPWGGYGAGRAYATIARVKYRAAKALGVGIDGPPL
jgi:hypothetical protein